MSFVIGSHRFTYLLIIHKININWLKLKHGVKRIALCLLSGFFAKDDARIFRAIPLPEIIPTSTARVTADTPRIIVLANRRTIARSIYMKFYLLHNPSDWLLMSRIVIAIFYKALKAQMVIPFVPIFFI